MGAEVSELTGPAKGQQLAASLLGLSAAATPSLGTQLGAACAQG